MANQGLIPAKWAALTPGGQAIYDVTADRRLTWRQFDDLVRRLANGLLARGLTPGDRVAVLSRNCAEYQALYFAAGRAGLVLQPLNWRLAAPELAAIVADAAPRALVAEAEWSAVVDELCRTVDVPHVLRFGPDGDGGLEELVEAASDEEPAFSAKIGDDDPFFILYTGGTTGQAKGALHSHRSAAAGMLNQTVAERIVPSDVYLLTGQLFHIPVVLAMNYLKHGCPLVMMNFEAKRALEVIEAERVSALLGITTMLNWMMAVEGFERYDLSSLRNIQYGGGPMPSAIVRQALEAFPCTLIQGYGQTEGSTMCFLSQEDHASAVAGVRPERLQSCGREGFGTQVRVVDETGRDVPQDGRTPGQIVVRSEANMLGYWNRPDLTAETLRGAGTPDSRGIALGGGWMWTGDIATWDEDRYVFIVDRSKDMIISGGENIFSVQVEEAIARHPAVLECAVIGVPDDEWGESVKAVVVLKSGQRATEAEIIEQARAHLAGYQKPKSVDFVAELPKAPTGKILKRELREPYWSGRERDV
ncbi:MULTISPECIES: AMP-binding protein [Prauserella salsuginis group]|uniref:AMP-binding protein n=1 Tax=Prauserella salsuginis TaxID=387889 RepID=A0ABW6G3M0_9PSEU|nr:MULTISPECIES: AMP-binding protein [Prauserella salsuginis group]MCR3718661.1 long-chain acyl-CoA synthetase [Prauserella flava]MCR3733231.1 long-chain acyl-CoA synthetase [Prauserella salsuginis]